MEPAPAQEKKRSFDTYTTRVENVEVLAPRNKNIRFRFLDGKSMDFKAGQYMQMFIPQPDKVRRTSYSIASPPRLRDGFELCVTLVDGGVSSTYLHGLKPGDHIQAMGPLGKFVPPQPLPRDAVFIATGSGVAPFRSMIHDLLDKGTDKKLYLIFGNRFEEDILYRKEWEELARARPSFKHMFTLSRAQWAGPRGYVQDQIESFIPDPREKDYYICGLTNMINGVSEKLKSLGVSPDQVHYERYD
jgi:CDP-4-dehydro-6-deoxyglucose reductase, E3